MILEAVVENINEVEALNGFNFNRLELVSGLDTGGLTPTVSMVKSSVENFSNVQVMIRPRTGGFCYSNKEISIMAEDIKILADYGIKGVVFGCLDSKGNLDKLSLERLFKIAKDLNLETTFHRAIDFCSNKTDALSFLQEIKINRLLSAGSKTTIEDGYEGIKNILNLVGNNVKVVAAGGINEKNVFPLLGLNVDVHIAIRKEKRNIYKLNLGGEYEVDYSKISFFSSINM